jgi:soluble lytic murein transglycosylase
MSRLSCWGLVFFLCIYSTLSWSQQISSSIDAQRRQFIAAYHDALQGRPDQWQKTATGLDNYPLYPYLLYAAYTKNISKTKPEDITSFLSRYEGSFLAHQLRNRWLNQLARYQQWKSFLAFWKIQTDPNLNCHWLSAKINLGEFDQLPQKIEALWLSAQKMPSSCNFAMGWYKKAGHLSTKLIWRRLHLAASANQPTLMRDLALLLNNTARVEAQNYAKLIGNPSQELGHANTWADTVRSRRYISIALSHLARKNEALAATQWNLLKNKFAFDTTEKQNIIAAIALYKAANYRTDAAFWLNQVSKNNALEAVYEWRVREALARNDLVAALEAIDFLSPTQKNDPRWRYLEARLLDLNKQTEKALVVFKRLSTETNFYGFLAADRLQQSYSICPLSASKDPLHQQRIAQHPAVTRILELHALGWHTEARREWQYSVEKFSREDRVTTVSLAHQQGWIDRGPLTLLRPDEIRYYALRFPVGYPQKINDQAKLHHIDPAWVFGLIRSESAWHEHAISSANARGLMQIIPSTAKILAKKENLNYDGPSDLLRPTVAIRLGTRHMADELSRYQNRIWLAIAAYNAGPAPVARWLTTRPNLPVDLWIETIPYKETREYVARVLAFTTIYDWLLTQKVTRVSERLNLIAPTKNKNTVVCALPTITEISNTKP